MRTYIVVVGICALFTVTLRAADLVIAPGITIDMVDHWSAQRDSSTTWLLERRDNAGHVVATMSIETEQRDSHADAVQQLAAINAGLDARGTYSTIAGWPALERKVQQPYEIPDDVPDDDYSKNVQIPASGVLLAWETSTAVAAGAQLVTVDTLVHPSADPAIADEALSIGRTLALPAGDGSAANDVQQLTSGALDPQPVEIDDSTVVAATADSSGGQAKVAAGPAIKLAGPGEDEAAISSGAQGQALRIVVTGACTPSFSNDGGATFATGKLTDTADPPRVFDGDCSVAWAPSGSFYISRLGGSGTHLIPVYKSAASNNGTFTFVASASTGSSLTENLDQPHIAADRVNTFEDSAKKKHDLVYAVWRETNQFRSRLACSKDDGLTWHAPVHAKGQNHSFARVTVGPDGSVYVISPAGNSITLDKFSGCAAANPLTRQDGFPTRLTFAPVVCPIAGLDRCNAGNIISSPMVAADDLIATRVYIGLASVSSKYGVSIGVTMSNNGGKSFRSKAVPVTSKVIATRYLPWIGVSRGVVHVAWYDRRNATTPNPGLTSYYRNTLSIVNGSLTAGTEIRLNTADDHQCASGFPCGARALGDVSMCPGQVNFGFCVANNVETGARCDPRAPAIGTACTTGTCTLGRGCPKFGDYNGLAVGGGKVVNVWASGTPPTGGATIVGKPSAYVVVSAAP
jgi:hypothetical protein